MRGEIDYNWDTGADKLITKKGKHVKMISPKKISIGVGVKKAKLVDVNNLLSKHFGENWRDFPNLQWYKDVIDKNNSYDQEEEEETCECTENCVDDEDLAIVQIT